MVGVTHLLDTNAMVAILRGTGGRIVDRIETRPPGSLAISAVSLAELSFGAGLAARESESVRVRRLVSNFVVVPFDAEIAWEYGQLRTELSRKGKAIGGLDMLIAATARRHGWILVTHNTREFGRIANLQLEDWES